MVLWIDPPRDHRSLVRISDTRAEDFFDSSSEAIDKEAPPIASRDGFKRSREIQVTIDLPFFYLTSKNCEIMVISL